MAKVMQSEGGAEFTIQANADLSTNQFQPVVVNTSGKVALSAALTDFVIGVLQNKPGAAGEAAQIAGPGCVTKCKAGGTIDEGELVGPDGSGAAITVTADHKTYFGIALSPASSGDYFDLLVLGPNFISV